MPLIKTNSIQLKTALGTSEVQLLVGDITDLSQEEAVDIIIVSTFQGDYSTACLNTLVSALSRKLDVDIADLSRNKQVDMRSNFFCWVSKPLSKHLPFKRLVCFERARRADSGSTAQQISVLYRAMTPLFNNEDTTVITPLLATGNQGQSRTAVLRAMVDGACHWIKAGLPLRCLKLVLFAHDPNNISKRDKEAIELFTKLKQVWEASNLKQSSERQQHDVYISHSESDEKWATSVCREIQLVKSSLKVYKQQVEFDADQVWQKDLFQVMMQSRKIIVILSPSYVSSPKCLEQFNMALCVIRLSTLHQICPLYVETVPSFPTYMLLVQYVECRERKPGDKTNELIKSACKNLLTSESSVQQSTQEQAPAAVTNVQYDVFISYAHKNPKSAETLLKYFQESEPSLNVFFDRSELTTGSLWQQTLYNAMDQARCVVALLSPAYIRSDVCGEEYNIALNRALAGRGVSLVPVCVETTETLPKPFSYVPILDAASEEQDGILKQVSEEIIQQLREEGSGERQCLVQIYTGIAELFRMTTFETASLIAQLTSIASNQISTFLSRMLAVIEQRLIQPNFFLHTDNTKMAARKQEFEKYYKRKDKTILHKSQPQSTNSKSSTEVVFSFSHDSISMACILTELIKELSPKTDCKFISENNKERLHLLDQAKLVVILVSDGYIESPQLLEELHLSLCRQRREKPTPVVYLIQAMHLNKDPFFLHLLSYRVSLGDKLWSSLIEKGSRHVPVPQMFTITRNGMKGSYSCSMEERYALSLAALEITDVVNGRPSPVTVGPIIMNLGALHQGDTIEDTVPLHQCLTKISMDEKTRKTSSVDNKTSNSEEISDEQPVTDKRDTQDRAQTSPDDTEGEVKDNLKLESEKDKKAKEVNNSIGTSEKEDENKCADIVIVSSTGQAKQDSQDSDMASSNRQTKQESKDLDMVVSEKQRENGRECTDMYDFDTISDTDLHENAHTFVKQSYKLKKKSAFCTIL